MGPNPAQHIPRVSPVPFGTIAVELVHAPPCRCPVWPQTVLTQRPPLPLSGNWDENISSALWRSATVRPANIQDRDVGWRRLTQIPGHATCLVVIFHSLPRCHGNRADSADGADAHGAVLDRRAYPDRPCSRAPLPSCEGEFARDAAGHRDVLASPRFFRDIVTRKIGNDAQKVRRRSRPTAGVRTQTATGSVSMTRVQHRCRRVAQGFR